jgi:hypothetical protein
LARLNIMKPLPCAPTAYIKTSCHAYQANYLCVLIDDNNQAKLANNMISLKASPAVLSMWLKKYFSHPSFSDFSPTPPIKLKLGVQIGGRLLIATHLDQSKYLTNQKQGAANEYDFAVFLRLFF